MASLVPIDYTSKDYEGFRQSMLSYASIVYPEWTGRSQADFGVALVELFAYMGDILSYYGDRTAREAFIGTANQRSSLLAHAAILGYSPHGYTPASGDVTFVSATDQATPVVIPAGTKVATDYIPSYDASIVFETKAAVTVPASGGTVIATVVQGVTGGATTKILNAGAGSQANVTVSQIGTSDGSMDQSFRIPDAPVIDGSVRVFVDDTLNVNPNAVQEWTTVSTLLSATLNQSAFSVSNDDTNATFVNLGDGVNGQVPSQGIRVYAAYRVGGGTRGNLDIGAVKNFVVATTGVSIQTSGVMSGGTNPETNDSIRMNAPKAFRVQDRAVTLRDYEDLALTLPSITKAKAIAGNSTSVTVFVVGPQGAIPNAAALTQVQTLLTSKALLGTSVTVLAGTKIYVNIGTASLPVRIGVYQQYSSVDVQSSVEQAINALLDPSTTTLGQRISVSGVYAAAMAVPGVAYVTLPALARSTDVQTGVNDILCREWEFPVVGSLSVTAEAFKV